MRTRSEKIAKTPVVGASRLGSAVTAEITAEFPISFLAFTDPCLEPRNEPVEVKPMVDNVQGHFFGYAVVQRFVGWKWHKFVPLLVRNVCIRMTDVRLLPSENPWLVAKDWTSAAVFLAIDR